MSKIDETKKTITKTVTNVWDFIEALSAVITSAFAIYGSYHYVTRVEYRYALFTAGVVMALIGGRAIVKHFNK